MIKSILTILVMSVNLHCSELLAYIKYDYSNKDKYKILKYDNLEYKVDKDVVFNERDLSEIKLLEIDDGNNGIMGHDFYIEMKFRTTNSNIDRIKDKRLIIVYNGLVIGTPFVTKNALNGIRVNIGRDREHAEKIFMEIKKSIIVAQQGDAPEPASPAR